MGNPQSQSSLHKILHAGKHLQLQRQQCRWSEKGNQHFCICLCWRYCVIKIIRIY